MTNQIIEFLKGHASVRQFTDEVVSEVDELEIVRTAQRSPTSSNLQAYSVIATRDREMKTELAALCGNQDHVAECPLFLIFCADLYRLERLCIERGYPCHTEWTEIFIVATVDAALAAGRALQAAQAKGLGGVMVGSIRNNPQRVSELLGLPHLVYPVVGMSLGYPRSAAKTKPRLPLDAMFFREKYRADRIPEAVGRYDDIVNESGHLKGREYKPEKYPNFTGTYSWSEHSARRMAEDSNGAVRPHMRKYLEGRGFLLK